MPCRITGSKHITAELYSQERPERRACATLAKLSDCATIEMLLEGRRWPGLVWPETLCALPAQEAEDAGTSGACVAQGWSGGSVGFEEMAAKLCRRCVTDGIFYSSLQLERC